MRLWLAETLRHWAHKLDGQKAVTIPGDAQVSVSAAPGIITVVARGKGVRAIVPSPARIDVGGGGGGGAGGAAGAGGVRREGTRTACNCHFGTQRPGDGIRTVSHFPFCPQYKRPEYRQGGPVR